MAEPTTIRRGLVLIVVAGLVFVGLAVDHGVGGHRSLRPWQPAKAAAEAPLVEVPPSDTLSAAWYCPEGTSDPKGRADETVVIANAGDAPVSAEVRVLLGPEKAPVRKAVEVGARSRQEVRIADLVKTAEPGVVVEVFGGDVAVEHVLRGSGDVATAPCVRHPASRWLFAGGTTEKDSREVLALLNPFDDDAVVDMTFFTEDGAEAPTKLQSLDVPARSRLAVVVDDYVLRKQRVAALIVARSGRIAAEESLSWDGSTDRRGLGVLSGTTDTAPNWVFPEGQVQDGIAENIWILNPGTIDTEVQVQPVLASGKPPAAPETVAVPAQSAVSYSVNKVVGNGEAHAVVVDATGGGDVVAAQEILSSAQAPRPGTALVVGISAPALRWLLAAGSADETTDEWIVVSNQTLRPAHVGISVLADGVQLVPQDLGDLEVPPASRLPIRLGDALKRSDPVMVRSDRPVAVTRSLFTSGSVSVAPGVPFAD